MEAVTRSSAFNASLTDLSNTLPSCGSAAFLWTALAAEITAEVPSVSSLADFRTLACKSFGRVEAKV